MLLILGVGGFLLPKLFGNQPIDPEILRKLKLPRNQVVSSFILGLIFLMSYGVEVWVSYPMGIRAAYAIRAGIWFWFLIARLGLHRKISGLPGYLSGARIALFSMGLGLALPVFMPVYLIAWEHVIFITGLLWLTLSVATRVLTAHGGRLDLLTKNRKQILVFGILVVLSAITRVSTDIWTKGHFLHLALASTFAICALIIWARIYFPLLSVFPAGRK